MREQSARFSEVRALIFDLDGTLIDSKLDLALAVNAALEELGRGPAAARTDFQLRRARRSQPYRAALWETAPPKKIACAASNSSSSIIPCTNSTTPRCILASAKPSTLLTGCPWPC